MVLGHWLLGQIRKGPLYKFAVGFAVLFMLLSLFAGLVSYPIKQTYYSLLGGGHWLNVKSVATIEPRDGSPVLEFCRAPRTNIVAMNNIRTFYDARTNADVYQRHLPDGIAYESSGPECRPITIADGQRPEAPGEYYFCQTLEFVIQFSNKKTATFCSDNFIIGGK